MEWADADLVTIDYRGDMVLAVSSGAFESDDETRSRFLIRSAHLRKHERWERLVLNKPPFTLRTSMSEEAAPVATPDPLSTQSSALPVANDFQDDPDRRVPPGSQAEAAHLQSIARRLPHYRIAHSDDEAVGIALCAMHLNFTRLPSAIRLSTLVALARHCEDFHTHYSMELVLGLWLDRLLPAALESPSFDWLYVSWVFRLPFLFEAQFQALVCVSTAEELVALKPRENGHWDSNLHSEHTYFIHRSVC